MPMKPHKGESQDDFMKRCVPEMMGDGKREQDQAVAACLDIWRSKAVPKKTFADPGYQGDRKPRFPLDTPDDIRMSWYASHKATNYTDGQMERIFARVTLAWKAQIGPELPSPDDPTLRSEFIRKAGAYAPDPDPDESHDDFIDRCVDEMTDDDHNMDDDEAMQACQLAWDEWDTYNSQRSKNSAIIHKTHAAPAEGMEFIMSDATPDRFGDIVEVEGWDLENFKKNPIALFGHNKEFPIGKWINIRVHDNQDNNKDLRAELVLAPKGTSPRIDEIRRLIEADILRATSVGFRPLEDEPIKGTFGSRFKKQELVECSLVAVPANPNALSVAKSLNISADTVRMVFGEHANKDIVRRDFQTNRGEDANKRDVKNIEIKTGEHAEPNRERKDKPMLLSQRIQEAERNKLTLQDQLDKHLETIDDENPSEEQMVITEDLTAKIEKASRHLANLKAIETKNGSSAENADELANKATNGRLPPPDIVFPKKKIDPVDYIVRAALVRAKAKVDNASIDDTRRKIYGDHDATRVACDYMLKAASNPAEMTVTGWAAELVRTIWSAWMDVLLPMSVYPQLASKGLALTFGANGRIIIPTRQLTPSISGSFVGEGLPIPVRQGFFTSQTVTPKKLAVITTWTREMDQYSIPAIEGLLRQAILEDTAISLDTVLLDTNAATTIRPPGLRSYQTGLTASAVAGQFFANFTSDYGQLMQSLISLTNGNVRRPVLILNPAQTLKIALIQPPAAATPLFPFATMVDGGRVLQTDLISSTTVPTGVAIMVDAADFTGVGAEGPRLEISDQATLHMEDTTPADIVSGTGTSGTPATPVKSMWQTDSLALRLIMMMNWIMRRPVVAWMPNVLWG